MGSEMCIRDSDGEDEETFLDFLAQYEVYRCLKKWRWVWKKNLQGWERRSSGKFTILLFFLRKRRRWAFSLFKQIRFRPGFPGIHQPFRGFFGLIFPTKRIFEPTVLLLKKAARCHPFLAVVRCLFHNHLRLKRSSLLNVHLNYKFEFSLLTSHLFFSLFIFMNIITIARQNHSVGTFGYKIQPKMRFET